MLVGDRRCRPAPPPPGVAPRPRCWPRSGPGTPRRGRRGRRSGRRRRRRSRCSTACTAPGPARSGQVVGQAAFDERRGARPADAGLAQVADVEEADRPRAPRCARPPRRPRTETGISQPPNGANVAPSATWSVVQRGLQQRCVGHRSRRLPERSMARGSRRPRRAPPTTARSDAIRHHRLRTAAGDDPLSTHTPTSIRPRVAGDRRPTADAVGRRRCAGSGRRRRRRRRQPSSATLPASCRQPRRLGATGKAGEVDPGPGTGGDCRSTACCASARPGRRADEAADLAEQVRKAAGAASRAAAGHRAGRHHPVGARPRGGRRGHLLGRLRLHRYKKPRRDGRRREPVALTVGLVAATRRPRPRWPGPRSVAEAVADRPRLGQHPARTTCTPPSSPRARKALGRGGRADGRGARREGARQGRLRRHPRRRPGSTGPPRLVRLELHAGRSRRPKVALVGKGITFDTGGISHQAGREAWTR